MSQGHIWASIWPHTHNPKPQSQAVKAPVARRCMAPGLMVSHKRSLYRHFGNSVQYQPSPTIPGPGWWIMLSGVLQLFMDKKLNQKLPQSFTFAFTNIRGLLSNIDHLNLFLCQQAPLLFAYSETKLSNKILDSELSFPNYTMIREDHPPHHGLCLYLHSSLSAQRCLQYENSLYQYICLRLILHSNSKIIFFIYRSPSANSDIFCHLWPYWQRSSSLPKHRNCSSRRLQHSPRAMVNTL